jgi:hypothetical protein
MANSMTDWNRFYRKLWTGVLTASLMWGFTLASGAQDQSGGQPAPPPARGESASRGPTVKPAQAEPKISPQEAEELFRSVDQILQFASTDTGLPIKHEVKRRLASREEVVGYLAKSMSEDKDAQRLRRSELVLKKFGLLPRDFDMQSFLVELLKEQVAGYYDPKTKTVSLLDWLRAEQQKPVLAHELTHALQDQSFGLKKWMQAGAADLEEKKEPTPSDIESDELSEVRQAIVEGQAMVVLVDYTFRPAGRSVKDSPELVQALEQQMTNGSPDSPAFRTAPIFLRETLTFPYRYGMEFVAAVLRKEGKDRAFAGSLAAPPRITRQIMEPQTYLSGEKIEPMPLPDFKQVFRNYDRFDIGAIGEFDVSVLIDEYADETTSHYLYPHWRGGYYYAARPKGATSAPLGLLYVSRWSDAESSESFGAIYAKSLLKRYKLVQEVVEGSDTSLRLDTLKTLTGRHTWKTEEGPVVIEVEGDRAMVTESLDPGTSGHLAHELFAPGSTP